MTHKVQVPCFAGYLFIELDINHDPLHPVTKGKGVKRLFCSGTGRPIPVPRGVIEHIMVAAAERRFLAVELPAFVVGTHLRITAGPFVDHTGICLWSSETRTRLLMQVLGSEVAVTVPRGTVGKIPPP